MQGIKILAIAEVVTDSAFAWKYFFILGGIVLAVWMFAVIYNFVSDPRILELAANIAVGIFVATVIGGVVGMAFSTPVAYTTQYKVTISDDISASDFLKKYEIVEQEGQIYTIQERIEKELQ